MHKRILKQLNDLSTILNYELVGGDTFETADAIIFKKRSASNASAKNVDEHKYIFEDHMLKADFGFNQSFNKGNPPIEKILYGKTIKETEKMIYVKLYSKYTGKTWEGWTPKKSVTVV